MTKSVTSLDDLLFLGLREEVVGFVGDESLDDVSMASFTSYQKRRDALVQFWVKTSPFFEEDEDDGIMAILTGDDERSDLSPTGVDSSSLVDEDLDDLRVSNSAGHHQGGPATKVLSFQDVLAEEGLEDLDDLKISSLADHHQDRGACLIKRLDAWVLKVLEDELDDLDVSTETGHHQAGSIVVVLEALVHPGPVVDEDLEDLRTSVSLAGLHQGRLTLVVLEVGIGSSHDE
jgi:hypothetical protein